MGGRTRWRESTFLDPPAGATGRHHLQRPLNSSSSRSPGLPAGSGGVSAGWSWSGGPVTEGQVGAKGFCAADEEEGGQTTVGIKDQSRTRGPWNCPRVPRDKEDVGDLGGRGAARAQAQRGPSGDLRPRRGPAGICQQPGLGQGRRAGHLIQELGKPSR